MFSIRTKLILSLLLICLLSLGGMTFLYLAANREYETVVQTALTADQLNLEVLATWQWLTDISATRAARGLDDGFAEAEKASRLFRQSLTQLRRTRPDLAAELDGLQATFASSTPRAGGWPATTSHTEPNAATRRWPASTAMPPG